MDHVDRDEIGGRYIVGGDAGKPVTRAKHVEAEMIGFRQLQRDRGA